LTCLPLNNVLRETNCRTRQHSTSSCSTPHNWRVVRVYKAVPVSNVIDNSTSPFASEHTRHLTLRATPNCKCSSVVGSSEFSVHSGWPLQVPPYVAWLALYTQLYGCYMPQTSPLFVAPYELSEAFMTALCRHKPLLDGVLPQPGAQQPAQTHNRR